MSDSPDDVKKPNVLSVLENAGESERRDVMENLQKANAYSLSKMNNGLNYLLIL